MRRVLEPLVTGLWLGLAQVALSFALLVGAGASALQVFLVTAAWLAGGAIGTRSQRSTPLLALALAALVVGRLALAFAPFARGATALALVAAVACGAYAGSFLATRATIFGDARAVLFHENNGFLAGWILGGVMLFVHPLGLDVIVLVLGVGLVAEALKVGPRRLVG